MRTIALVIVASMLLAGHHALVDHPASIVSVVPLAEDKPVCGWKTFQVDINRRMNPAEIERDIGAQWTELGFDDSGFRPSSMPMGDNIYCEQLKKHKEAATFWKVRSNLFVRREFVLAQVTYDRIASLDVAIVVDNDIVSVNVNGERFGESYPTRDHCDGVSRVDHVKVPKDRLRVGRNVFALHVHDRGGQAFLNIALDFEFAARGLTLCSELDSAPGICRKRCEEINQCYNSDDCAPGYEVDVDGQCLCEVRETMFCTGPTADFPSNVCYSSPWIVGMTAAKVVCPENPHPCR